MDQETYDALARQKRVHAITEARVRKDRAIAEAKAKKDRQEFHEAVAEEFNNKYKGHLNCDCGKPKPKPPEEVKTIYRNGVPAAKIYTRYFKNLVCKMHNNGKNDWTIERLARFYEVPEGLISGWISDKANGIKLIGDDEAIRAEIDRKAKLRAQDVRSPLQVWEDSWLASIETHRKPRDWQETNLVDEQPYFRKLVTLDHFPTSHPLDQDTGWDDWQKVAWTMDDDEIDDVLKLTSHP